MSDYLFKFTLHLLLLARDGLYELGKIVLATLLLIWITTIGLAFIGPITFYVQYAEGLWSIWPFVIVYAIPLTALALIWLAGEWDKFAKRESNK
jgi:hypothetical protein